MITFFYSNVNEKTCVKKAFEKIKRNNFKLLGYEIDNCIQGYAKGETLAPTEYNKGCFISVTTILIYLSKTRQ